MTESKSAKVYALSLIAKRDYSVKALTDKLISKKYPKSEIESVIAILTDSNLINDRRYAEALHYSLTQRGYGAIYIKQKLKQKGIPTDVTNELITQFDQSGNSEEFNETVGSLVDRKQAQGKDYQKVYAFLVRRGYKPGEFIDILKQKFDQG